MDPQPQGQDHSQTPPTQHPSNIPPASPGQPPNTGASMPRAPMIRSHNRLKYPTVVVALLILAGAAAYFITKDNNENSQSAGGGGALICSPTVSPLLTQENLITAYKNFAKAVVAKDQNCTNELSTGYFLTASKQEFSAPDGKWITSSVAGLPPISDSFAKLPSTFTGSGFKQTAYKRAITLGSSQPQSPATGTTLSYPVQGSTDTYVSVSFVLDKDSIKVDDVTVGLLPQS